MAHAKDTKALAEGQVEAFPVAQGGAENQPPQQVDEVPEVQGQGRRETGGPTVSQPGGQHAGRLEYKAKPVQTEREEDRRRDAWQADEAEYAAFMNPRKATRNPKGGLTAAGRQQYARDEGAHLKPGVKKPRSRMTPEEMKRKGSWAVRFYGRQGKLPPLRDKNGKPTRFALTAAAWGEPVPRTAAAARRIAAKGRRLLQAYQRSREPKRRTG